MQSVTLESDYQKIIRANSKVVFKFGAKWCGPCKKIQPVLDKLAAEKPGVKFVIVDVDDAVDISDRDEATVLPTFLVYINGQPTAKIEGTNMSEVIAALG